MAAGTDGYISKPFQWEELQQAIAQFFPEEAHAAPAAPGGATIASPQFAPTEVIDRDAVLSRIKGDRKRLQKMIGMFEAECPRLLAALRESVAKNDALAVQRAAHTLKGAVGSLGAGAAFQAAKAVEERGRANTLADVGNDLIALDEHLARLRAALQQLGAEETP